MMITPHIQTNSAWIVWSACKSKILFVWTFCKYALVVLFEECLLTSAFSFLPQNTRMPFVYHKSHQCILTVFKQIYVPIVYESYTMPHMPDVQHVQPIYSNDTFTRMYLIKRINRPLECNCDIEYYKHKMLRVPAWRVRISKILMGFIMHCLANMWILLTGIMCTIHPKEAYDSYKCTLRKFSKIYVRLHIIT